MTREELYEIYVGDVIYCNYNFSTSYMGHGMYGYTKGFYTVVKNNIKEDVSSCIPCIDKYGRLSMIPYCFCELNNCSKTEREVNV